MHLLQRLRIERILTLPTDLNMLIELSEREGFQFLKKLRYDFETGENRFDQYGEGLFAVYKDQNLIAVGGVSQDPFDQTGKMGRLRRFYIHPDCRQKTVGAYLLKYIKQYAQTYFKQLCLYTDTKNAANFYQRMGYESVDWGHSNFRKVF